MSNSNGTGEPVQDVAQDVSAELREIGRELRSRANDVRKEAVKQLNTAAETIRKEARERGADDSTLKGADDVAKGLEKAAQYLNSHSVEQFGSETARVVRRNPLRALVIAFGVGLLMGILMGSGKKS